MSNNEYVDQMIERNIEQQISYSLKALGEGMTRIIVNRAFNKARTAVAEGNQHGEKENQKGETEKT